MTDRGLKEGKERPRERTMDRCQILATLKERIRDRGKSMDRFIDRGLKQEKERQGERTIYKLTDRLLILAKPRKQI